MDYKSQLTTTLTNMERLKVLVDLSLIGSAEETVYDRFTALASVVIGAPVSLVSMVASDHQFFKSQVGLPDPWKSQRRTPLSHSFCQHVVATNEPLIVSDAREVELLKDNGAIPDLNVIGYLGIPLTLSDGKSLGSFCVIDGEPREWEDVEIAIMKEFADLITLEFDMRASAFINRSDKVKLQKMHDSLEKVFAELDSTLDKHTFLNQIREVRRKHNI